MAGETAILTGALPGVTAAAAEAPLSEWIELFQAVGYSLHVATTVQLRNALLVDMAGLRGAFWLPKNVLVFRPTPPVCSRMAAGWRLATTAIVADVDRLQWFHFTPGQFPPALEALLTQVRCPAVLYATCRERTPMPLLSQNTGLALTPSYKISHSHVCLPHACTVGW